MYIKDYIEYYLALKLNLDYYAIMLKGARSV